jgi:Protein of unknown function (DUF3800)
MLVFIDESGDPGFKVSRGSSPVFTAVLVAFRDRAQAAPTQAAISNLAARLKIKPEFKFNKCRPEVRDAFFNAVAPFDFCVRAIVVKKEKIYSPHLRTNKEAFYNFFVRSMLRFDNGLLQSAKVVSDGSGDRQFKQELAAYFRRALPKGRIEKLSFQKSESDRLVQLADMCAGAIARSYRKDRDDAKRWRGILAPKIEDVWEFG